MPLRAAYFRDFRSSSDFWAKPCLKPDVKSEAALLDVIDLWIL